MKRGIRQWYILNIYNNLKAIESNKMISRDIINVMYHELHVAEFFGIISFKLSNKVNKNSLLAVQSKKSLKVLQRWEIFSLLLGVLTSVQIHHAVRKLKQNNAD